MHQHNSRATVKSGTCMLEGMDSPSHMELQGPVPIWAPRVCTQQGFTMYYDKPHAAWPVCAALTVYLHAGTTTALYGWHIASVRPVDPPQSVPAMRRVFSSWFLAEEGN